MSLARYRVLGEIAVDGQAVSRRRERELLGLLVAARGRPVAVERIVEELWEADGARSAVQVVVSRLRALLDPGRSGPVRVATTPAGYHLEAEPGEVDVWVFEDLAERSLSASTPADRVVLGTRADELWAGEPYAECEAPSLRAEAARLVELHVTVQESRTEALLSLGTRRPPYACSRRSFPSTPTASSCGRCWPGRSTPVRARPMRWPHWRRCAHGWPRTSGSTRRRSSARWSSRSWPRTRG